MIKNLCCVARLKTRVTQGWKRDQTITEECVQTAGKTERDMKEGARRYKDAFKKVQ